MSPRASALLVLAVLAVGAWPAPAADAQASGSPPPRCNPAPVRHATCLEALHFDPAVRGLEDHLYRVAWRPVPTVVRDNATLSDALIVGGTPSWIPGSSPHGVVMLYDGVTLSKLWDREGPQFVDVAWHPRGTYALALTDQKAIYRIDPPAAGRPQYALRNLWDDCGHVQIQGCADAYFQGRHVSFNPATGEAWIAGSSLLAYDGTDLSVVESGQDIAYRAVAWAPDGRTALLSALVCVDPSDVTVDVACPTNITAGDILPGRVIHADTSTNKLCEVFTYGQFNPQRAEVNDITWHPSGDYALIYGDDDFHGSILKFDARRAGEGLTEQGCPRLGSSFTYLHPPKDEGEFNKMAYNPTTGRFWVAAGAGQELWEGDGTRFLDMLGEHDLTGGRGTIYYGIAWDPTHTYVLVTGFQGRLYKIVPANAPFTHITTPKNNTIAAGEVVVAGKAFATSQFEHIEGVEGWVRPLRLEVNASGDAIGWFDAQVTATAGALANYTFAWDTAVLPAGHYQLRVQGQFAGAWRDLATRTIRASPSPTAADAGFDVIPPLEPSSPYRYDWSAKPAEPGQPRVYQMSANATVRAIAGSAGGTTPTAVRLELQPVAIALTPAGPEQAMAVTPQEEARGVRNWTFTWDARGLAPGMYQIEVRSSEEGVASNLARRVVQVVRPAPLAAPAFDPALPTTSSDGAYAVRWGPVDGEDVLYELEESVLPAEFAQAGAVALSGAAAFRGEEQLVLRAPTTTMGALGKADGVYVYRVRARDPASVSAWSAPLAISVAIDADQDGFSDQQEAQCGSQVAQAASTCTDVDADGVPNDADAFPLDHRQTKDSDGDGVGDGLDRYPLDYREWTDQDNDTWGDNAERRLGADSFDAASTPETDDDGDGCLNQDEAGARTDPKDPAAGPAFCLRTRAGVPGAPTNAPGIEALALLGVLGLLARAARRRS